MKSTEFINEAPLPDHWDTTVFSPGNVIKKQVDYVLANSKKLGTGSSRIVTSIMYQGRQTALKIAKNKKGLAQNEAELAIVDDGYAKNMNIVIPLIDYDKENDPPRWLQFEQASKTTERQLCAIMKCAHLSDVVMMADIVLGEIADAKGLDRAKILERNKVAGFTNEDKDIFYGYVNDLAMLADSFNIELIEFIDPRNWGIYKGKAVVVDIGFTSGVASSHYS